MNFSGLIKYALGALCILQLFLIKHADAEIQDWDDANFLTQLQMNKHAFVKFYSPNCPHCKRMAPTWNDLSSELDGVIPVVDIDCTSSGSNTCSEYKVRGYPTVKYIKLAGTGSSSDNHVVDYEKSRDLDSLKKFAEFHALPALTLAKGDDLVKFLESKYQVSLIAVFPESTTTFDESNEFYTTVESLAEQFKGIVRIKYTAEASVVFDKYPQMKQVQLPAVLLIRPTSFQYTEENAIELENKINNLNEFVRSKTYGLVPIVNEASEDAMAYPRITLWLSKDISADSETYAKYYTVLAPFARANRKFQFGMGHMAEFGQKAYHMGVDARSTRVFLFSETDANTRYIPLSDSSLKVDKLAEVVEQFIKDISENKLQKFIKSEPVPSEKEYDQQVVKTVVGRSFESIVLDETKDVLLEIYAPWCGHCKQLQPIYEQVATTLKGATNLVIAKIDGTANYIPEEYSFRGFPTIYFAKIGKKSSPMQYSGARDHKSFLEWLNRRVTHSIEEHVKDEL